MSTITKKAIDETRSDTKFRLEITGDDGTTRILRKVRVGGTAYGPEQADAIIAQYSSEPVPAQPVLVTNEAGLIEALASGKPVVLKEDIVLSEALVVSGDARLDLGGKTLSNSYKGTVNRKATTIHVKKGASLVLDGNGTVAGGSGSNNRAVWAEGGNVTINGGTYTVGPDAEGSGNTTIFNSGDGVIEINDGAFSSDAKYQDRYWTLNKKNGTAGKIEVKGGLFREFDPGHPTTDDEVSYLAEGYKSVLDGDHYRVVKA